jgi:aspartate aminotransferase
MDVHPDQVVIGPGSKSLLFAALLALGEEVIMPQPSWVSYGPQAHLLGKPITMVPTRPSTSFAIELDVLEEKIQESRQSWGNPEVLIVNSPGNPTGTMIGRDEAAALGAFAREHELMVLSDEIYSLTAHGPIPHTSVSASYPEGTVVFGGLSKSLPLGGWRFGVALVPLDNGGRALGKAIENIASNIWTCVTAPVQYAALVAYSGDPEVEEYIDLCARLHGVRTHVLYNRMVELGVPCVEPTGAFYIYPCFGKWREELAARGVHNDAELAFHLLENYQLATLPGSDFNAAQDFCLRISSSYVDAATDEMAERLLAAYREDPDPARFIEHHHPRLHTVLERFGEFVTDLDAGR